MDYPNIWKAGELVDHCVRCDAMESVGGNLWQPCRPLGMPTLRSRIRAAWLVFTGRADAVLWDFRLPPIAQPDRRALHKRHVDEREG